MPAPNHARSRLPDMAAGTLPAQLGLLIVIELRQTDAPVGSGQVLHIRDRIAGVDRPLELGQRTRRTPAALFHQLRRRFPLMPLCTFPPELGRKVDIGPREALALAAAGQLSHMGQRPFRRRIAGCAPIALKDQRGLGGPPMALGTLPAKFVSGINIGFR